jgi:hypothetical protein
MRDPIDSCNNPLFFMHHAYLDKLWWEWQMADYPHRLSDMGGNNAALIRFSLWLDFRSLDPTSLSMMVIVV